MDITDEVSHTLIDRLYTRPGCICIMMSDLEARVLRISFGTGL